MLVDDYGLNDRRAGQALRLTRAGVDLAASAVRLDTGQAGSKPLAIPLVGGLFDSVNPGIAGAVLLFLGMFRGWKMSLFALPAAAIIVLGPSLGIPGIAMFGGSHASSAAIGLGIATLGFLFGRTFDD